MTSLDPQSTNCLTHCLRLHNTSVHLIGLILPGHTASTVVRKKLLILFFFLFINIIPQHLQQFSEQFHKFLKEILMQKEMASQVLVDNYSAPSVTLSSLYIHFATC